MHFDRRVGALLGLLLLLALPSRVLRAEDEAPAEGQEAALQRAIDLHDQAMTLYGQGKFADALPLAREVLSIRERAYGPDHLEVAASLNNLGSLLKALGEYEEARALFVRAIAIREAHLGVDHPLLAANLNNLGALLRDRGRHAEARPLFERALAIREKALGPDHPKVAMVTSNLAGLLQALGDYEQAQLLYERSLAIRKKSLGPEHPLVGLTLSNLGTLFGSMGRLQEARPRIEHGVLILEKALGPWHPQVARGVNSLGGVHQKLGDYREALRLFERGFAIRERVFGPEHPWVAESLNNVANVLSALGLFERARAALERALTIWEKSLGPDHTMVAITLNNLALVLRATGQYAQALPLMERAIQVYEKALGPEHKEVANSLSNLGELQHRLGNSEQALALFARAIEILEKIFGSESVFVAGPVNNTAWVLQALGRVERSRAFFERARRILEKEYGPNHPHTGVAVNNVAGVLMLLERHEEARPLFERSLAIAEGTYGPEHPLVARMVGNLANVLGALGKYAQAAPLHDRCLNLVERKIRNNLSGLQSSERLAFTQTSRSRLDDWLDLAPRVGRTGYAEVLRFKGLVARATTAERRLARDCGEEAATRVETLRAAERRLSKIANSMPPMLAKEKQTAWKADYAEASAHREKLALELARDFAPLRVGLERLDIRLGDVQAQLAPGTVLVDVLRTNKRYLAWIVRSEGDAERIDLGGVEVVEDAAATFAELAADPDTLLEEEAWREAGRSLRALVVEPIEARLGDATRTVYLCPDAALAAVPFGALPGRMKGSFLIDEYLLVLVSTAQDLVPRTSERVAGTGMVVVGDVDYRSASVIAAREVEPPSRGGALDRAPRGNAFSPLPGTRDEAAFLKERLGEGCMMLLGADATEARVRAEVRGKRTLHLATHGFVRDNLMRGLKRRRGEQEWMGAGMERQLAAGHDPLNLAGLALAGANPRDGGHGDDGILTALEVSHLDLAGVELVVLSACQTALGKAESGEGVLGLVQGFQTAGAKRVVASLWQVDDEATRVLMEHFYAAMLRPTEPLAPAEALRRASLAVRASKSESGRAFAAPMYWAGFVLYGR